MKNKKFGKRAMALALSLTIVTSMAAAVVPAYAAPASASSSTIQLGSYLTKEMNYFAKGDSRIPTDGWVRDTEQYGGSLALLPFLGLSDDVVEQFADIGTDVTIALKDGDNVYWVALGEKGFMRIDFTEEDVRDVFQYFPAPATSMTATAPRNTL